jgi:hypothetical protein
VLQPVKKNFFFRSLTTNGAVVGVPAIEVAKRQINLRFHSNRCASYGCCWCWPPAIPVAKRQKKTFAPNKKPFLLLDAPATVQPKGEQQPGAGLEATRDFISISND